MSEIPAMPEHRYFAHEAMKTTYHLRVPPGDAGHLRDVAKVCFEALDQLESQLSRYVHGSDISRINAMEAGDRLFVTEACHACLLEAIEMHQRTGGLFDVTLGAQIEHVKSGAPGVAPALCGSLTVAPDRPLVVCNEAGRQIDLGGIGKGFALDRLRDILVEWQVGSALISAGASTHLAHGPLSWPVELAGTRDCITIGLRERALSASGTGIQGSHIVHPEAGLPPGGGFRHPRVWLTAGSAAAADAWSTAVMLMSESELREIGGAGPEALYVEDAGGIREWRAEGR